QLRQRDNTESFTADYFSEEVRRELLARQDIGQDGLYNGGYYVRTSLDPKLQIIADRVLRAGLVRYDQRHGYRGPVAQIDPGPDWQKRLAAVPQPIGLYDWRLGVVLDTGAASVHLGFADASEGTIPLAELKWAQRAQDGHIVGKAIVKASDALEPGDVVMAE